MKGFDKLRVKSAVKARSAMDLSTSHITTMDFGQCQCLYVNELVPGDKFDIKAQYFSRMAPLVKPTYGNFYFKTASFFVPMYQLADDAEAYISGARTWEGTTPYLRYISYNGLVAFLYTYCTTQVSSGSEDWVFVDSSGNTLYRKFTAFGKYCLKVLNALGYAIPQNVDQQSGSNWQSNFGSALLNAMPLLGFFKAYNDYMSQSQRYNTSQLTYILRMIKHNDTPSSAYYTPNDHCVTALGLNALFSAVRVCYENDYFTSAWQSPNIPYGSGENINSVIVPEGTYNGGSSTVSSNTSNQYYFSYSAITQRSLDFLKSFDDWVRRNNYSGSRIVQKVYSRFGIKTEDFRSNYAHLLGTSSTPLQIGDVTATASTDVTIGSETYNNVVGDYAGKGIVSDVSGCSYQASDYGYLYILGWYTVAPFNSYGFDRMVLRVNPLDFYTPEFDGLGADAISYGELFASPVPDTQDTTLDNQVFGFTERYNAYRYPRPRITGEMRNYDNASDMNVWHSGRLLTDLRKNNVQAQAQDMNQLPQNDSEYNRIFSYTGGASDHFYMTAKFKVNAVRPMLSLNQVPNLGEGNTVVDKNGNTIN